MEEFDTIELELEDEVSPFIDGKEDEEVKEDEGVEEDENDDEECEDGEGDEIKDEKETKKNDFDEDELGIPVFLKYFKNGKDEESKKRSFSEKTDLSNGVKRK